MLFFYKSLSLCIYREKRKGCRILLLHPWRILCCIIAFCRPVPSIHLHSSPSLNTESKEQKKYHRSVSAYIPENRFLTEDMPYAGKHSNQFLHYSVPHLEGYMHQRLPVRYIDLHFHHPVKLILCFVKNIRNSISTFRNSHIV